MAWWSGDRFCEERNFPNAFLPATRHTSSLRVLLWTRGEGRDDTVAMENTGWRIQDSEETTQRGKEESRTGEQAEQIAWGKRQNSAVTFFYTIFPPSIGTSASAPASHPPPPPPSPPPSHSGGHPVRSTVNIALGGMLQQHQAKGPGTADLLSTESVCRALIGFSQRWRRQASGALDVDSPQQGKSICNGNDNVRHVWTGIVGALLCFPRHT